MYIYTVLQVTISSNTSAGIFSCNHPLLHKAIREREYTAPTFLCIIVALQHYLKEITMFDLDKQVKEVTAQVKKYNEMWINWTITVLEQLKK